MSPISPFTFQGGNRRRWVGITVTGNDNQGDIIMRAQSTTSMNPCDHRNVRPLIPPSFEQVVEAFCLGQSELRARLARSRDGTAHPPEGCNCNTVTDNQGGLEDGQE